MSGTRGNIIGFLGEERSPRGDGQSSPRGERGGERGERSGNMGNNSSSAGGGGSGGGGRSHHNYNNSSDNSYSHRGGGGHNNNRNNWDGGKGRGSNPHYQSNGHHHGHKEQHRSISFEAADPHAPPPPPPPPVAVKPPQKGILHRVPDVPTCVKEYRDMLIALGNAVEWLEDDVIKDNIVTCIDLIQKQPEINSIYMPDFTDEIVKILEALPIHVSIISTLISALHQASQPLIGTLFEKLQTAFIKSLSQDDVISSKLLLRSFAVMTSAKMIQWRGEVGSMSALLSSLIDIATENKRSRASTSTITFNNKGLITSYIIASCVPWLVTAITNDSAVDPVVEKVRAFLQEIVDLYSSPFDVDAERPIFSANFDIADSSEGDAAPASFLCTGPAGKCSWDTLWEASKVALEMLNSPPETLPRCMQAFWVDLFYTDGSPFSTDEKPALSFDNSTFVSLSTVKLEMGKTYTGILDVNDSIGVNEVNGRYHWLFPRFPIITADILEAGQEGTCFSLSNFEKYYFSSLVSDTFKSFEVIIHADGCYSGKRTTQRDHILAIERLFTGTFQRVFLNEVNSAVPAAECDAIFDRAFKAEYIIMETFFQMMCHNSPFTAANLSICRMIRDLCKIHFYPTAFLTSARSIYPLTEVLVPHITIELAKVVAFYIINSTDTVILNFPMLKVWIQEIASENSIVGNFTDEANQAVAYTGSMYFVRTIVDSLCRQTKPSFVKRIIPESAHCWTDSISHSVKSSLFDARVAMLAAPERGAESTYPEFSLYDDLWRQVELSPIAETIEEFLNDYDTPIAQGPSKLTYKAEYLLTAMITMNAQSIHKFSKACKLLLPVFQNSYQDKTNQMAMIGVLVSICGHDICLLMSFLEVLLKFDIIFVEYAADFFTDVSNTSLDFERSSLSLVLLDSIVHRAINYTSNQFVKYLKSPAADVRFGESINMDALAESARDLEDAPAEPMTVTPAPVASSSSSSSSTMFESGNEIVDYGDADEDDNGTKRAKYVDQSALIASFAIPSIATEEVFLRSSLYQAISGCRKTFTLLVSNILARIEFNAGSELANTLLASALQKILMSYAVAERHLTDLLDNGDRVALASTSDASAAIAAKGMDLRSDGKSHFDKFNAFVTNRLL